MSPAQIDGWTLRHAPRSVLNRALAHVFFEGRPPGTKLQFLNRVDRTTLGLLARREPPKQPSQVAFIVGAGRSGTTLLGQLLNVHPSIGWLNEPKLPWGMCHPGEDLLGHVSDDIPSLHLDRTDVAAANSQLLHRVYGWFAALTGASVVVDKYPELVYRPEFVRGVFPGCTFVALVRHPAAAMRSIASWRAPIDDGNSGWWGIGDRKWTALAAYATPLFPHLDPNTTDEPTRAGVEWLCSSRATQALIASEPDAVLVRYEDLCEQPVEQLRRITSALGLEQSQRLEDYAQAIMQPSSTPTDPLDRLPTWLQDEIGRTARELGYEPLTGTHHG